MPDTAPNENTNRPVIETYEGDLSLAMDATDAKVVQELLATARNKESAAVEREHVRRQRGWYTAGGFILLLLALLSLGYGIYYYKHLTVPITEQIKVGVFQSLDPVDTSTTTVDQALDAALAHTDLPEGKPFLLPLVTDSTSLAPLSVEQVLSYIHGPTSEPFIAANSLVRLGVLNTGTQVAPFIIFSVPDPDIATKEFLIAEPTLLADLATGLRIDLTRHQEEVGKGFVSSYMYNLPVRSVRSLNIDTGEETLILYYGFASDHTIVAASNPSILKAVYDTIIRQH